MNQIYRYKLNLNDELYIIDIVTAYLNCNNKFYIYIDDRFTEEIVFMEKIKILENFGIIPTKIIKFSEYSNILWVYLNRLIQLKEAYILNSINSEDDIKKIKVTREFKIMFHDMCIFDDNIYNEMFYEIVIDDNERITDIILSENNNFNKLDSILINNLRDVLKLNKPLINTSDLIKKIESNFNKISTTLYDDISLLDIDLKYLLDMNIKLSDIIDIINRNFNMDKYIIKFIKFRDTNGNTDMDLVNGVYIEDPISVKLIDSKNISLWDKNAFIVDDHIYIEHDSIIKVVNANKTKLKYAGFMKIRKTNNYYSGSWEEPASKSKNIIFWLPKSAIILDGLDIAIYSKHLIDQKSYLIKIKDLYSILNIKNNEVQIDHIKRINNK